MSNCIEISEASELLRLPSAAFDIGAFRTAYEQHQRAATGRADDSWYWFLSTNVRVMPEQVTVRLGQGRSIHTWRDFRWTLLELSQFMTGRVQHRFIVGDEGDGFKMGYLDVVLEPKVVHVGKERYTYTE